MILPISVYGDPVLKKRASELSQDYPNLKDLVNNMWETMYNANGVGLAAPQIGRSIRLFIIDTIQLLDEESSEKPKIPIRGVKQVFINPKIIEKNGDEWSYEEGCLSIPEIRADVSRQAEVKIEYFDLEFNHRIDEFYGIDARVILHEFDHVEGILFTEKISPLKKSLLSRKLDKIRKGKVTAEYPLKVK